MPRAGDTHAFDVVSDGFRHAYRYRGVVLETLGGPGNLMVSRLLPLRLE